MRRKRPSRLRDDRTRPLGETTIYGLSHATPAIYGRDHPSANHGRTWRPYSHKHLSRPLPPHTQRPHDFPCRVVAGLQRAMHCAGVSLLVGRLAREEQRIVHGFGQRGGSGEGSTIPRAPSAIAAPTSGTRPLPSAPARAEAARAPLRT